MARVPSNLALRNVGLTPTMWRALNDLAEDEAACEYRRLFAGQTLWLRYGHRRSTVLALKRRGLVAEFDTLWSLTDQGSELASLLREA